MTDFISSNPEVSRFVQSTRPMLIGGKWVNAVNGGEIEVNNPATGQAFARVAAADADDIDQAVMAAREAFASAEWRDLTPSERGQLLWRVADLIDEHTDLLAYHR